MDINDLISLTRIKTEVLDIAGELQDGGVIDIELVVKRLKEVSYQVHDLETLAIGSLGGKLFFQ